MAYADEVLADSPYGYWKCDETVGTTLADSSGNGFTGTLNGGYTLDQAGPLAGVKSTVFTNSSLSYLQATITSWTPAELTIEYWIRANGIADFYPQVGLQEWGGWGSRFWSHGDNASRVYFGTGPNSSTSRLEIANAYSPVSTWYHIAFTCTSGKVLTVYRNGVSIGTGTRSSFNLATAATWFRFGYHANFCHVAIYPTALSQARVQAHYQQFFPPVVLAPWRRARRSPQRAAQITAGRG